jgi:hypothetical protein
LALLKKMLSFDTQNFGEGGPAGGRGGGGAAGEHAAREQDGARAGAVQEGTAADGGWGVGHGSSSFETPGTGFVIKGDTAARRSPELRFAGPPAPQPIRSKSGTFRSVEIYDPMAELGRVNGE